MKSFKELLTDTLEEKIAKPSEKEYKDKITKYQAKEYRAGNKITWDEAKAVIDQEIKAADKAAKKAAKALLPKKPKSDNMTKREFDQIMKQSRKDFEADFSDSDYEIADIAWDVAGSMMYDKKLETYVRRVMAKNTGKKPEQIDRNMVQEFIADSFAG